MGQRPRQGSSCCRNHSQPRQPECAQSLPVLLMCCNASILHGTQQQALFILRTSMQGLSGSSVQAQKDSARPVWMHVPSPCTDLNHCRSARGERGGGQAQAAARPALVSTWQATY